MFISNTILEAIRDKSAVECLFAPMPPEIARGKQVYKFEVGQTYKASGVGSLKAGTPITIVGRYKQHGFAYYKGDNGMVHREKDLA